MAWLAALVAAGCGNGYQPLQPEDFGAGPGDVGPSLDAGTLDGPVLNVDGGQDPMGPMITLVSPMANAEVQYNVLAVKVTVTSPIGTPILADQVRLSIPGGLSTTLAPDGTPDEYAGQIDIGSIQTGNSNFVVTAADLNMLHGILNVSYVHDRGPVITFLQPTQPTAKGGVTLTFVANDPLHPIDPNKITAGIRPGTETALMLTPATPSKQIIATGMINFQDALKYSPALNGEQLIHASATSMVGTVSNATLPLYIDNEGPTIVFGMPTSGSFIGGILQISATITDRSGVNSSTVLAVFGGDLKNSTPLTDAGGGMYTGTFDVGALGPNYMLPNFSIRADDNLGNHSELAIEVIVDNVAPTLSLRNEEFRVRKQVTETPDGGTAMPIWECSQLFYPLGLPYDSRGNAQLQAGEQPKDGATVLQVFWLKANVQDNGNSAPGAVQGFIAGIDQNSVELVAIPSSNGPLAVDTNGDGVCDDVNPLLLPTGGSMVTASNQSITVQMSSIPLQGVADYTPDPNAMVIKGVCDAYGETGFAIQPTLCNGSTVTTMTYVLPYADPPTTAIWSIPTIAANQTECVGLQFDSLSKLPEGPTCVVARGRDNAGNHSVSRPLRVCIDRGGGKCPSGWPLPDCTGTYNRSTNTAMSAPVCVAPFF